MDGWMETRAGRPGLAAVTEDLAVHGQSASAARAGAAPARNGPGAGPHGRSGRDSDSRTAAEPIAGRGLAERGKPCAGGHAVVDLTEGCGSVARAVAEAVAAGVPARRVASRSASNILVSVASGKMGGALAAESPWEGRAMTLADVLEDVLAFSPQPVELRWFDGERVRRAYPDLGVVLLDGRAELWECKPSDADHRLASKLAPLAAALARRGVRYRARTPRWLAATPRLANARQLAFHGSRPPDPAVSAAVAKTLPLLSAAMFGALREATGAGTAQLLCAAAHGVFAVCIDGVPLGDASPVRAPKPGARSGAYLYGES